MTQKGKNVKDTAVILASLAVIAFVVIFAMGGMPGSVTFVGKEPVAPVAQLIDFTPNVTVQVTDVYSPGTAVTTKLMWRVVDSDLWTNMVNGGSIDTLNAGTVIQLVVGIDTSDETAEPYGEIMTYTIPSTPSAILPIKVANDALASDIGTQYYDEDDNSATNQVTSANTNIKVSARFTAETDEDFGNINVGSISNVLVFKYNSTQAEGVSINSVTVNGLLVEVSPITTPTVHAGATGFDTQAYTFPVFQDGAKTVVNYEVDATSTALNTTIAAFTLSVYDSGHYLNTKDGANEVLSGVMDEDGDEIGAANPVTITPSFGA